MTTVTVYAPGATVEVFGRQVNVASLSALLSALSAAKPGDYIKIAAGTYTLTNQLVILCSGTVAENIVIEGEGSSTVINTNQKGMFLDASHCQLRNLRLTNFNTVGLWLRGVTGTKLDGVEIDHTANEALAFKNGSHHNVIQRCLFHDTGLVNPQYGEGVYIGNSAPLDAGVTDNQILDSHFGPNVRADHIDVKTGANRTIIRGNTFDGTGGVYISGATVSLVSILANDVLIESNSFKYGNIHAVSFVKPTSGIMGGNIATNNTVDLQDIHQAERGTSIPYGFQFQAGTVNPMGAVIRCNNVMVSGILSNRPCTP